MITTRDKLSEQRGIKFTEKTDNRLVQIAEETKTSISDVVRHAVDQFILSIDEKK